MEFRISEKRNPVFEVRGFSHVALVCADMQRTVDFYQGVLGFPLVKTTEIPNGGGQHFFFDVGDGVNSLAFFYFPKKQVAEPGVTVPRNNVADPSTAFDHDAYTTAIGSINHLAFNVAPEMIPRYKEKLESLGIWVSPIMYHYKNTATLGVELKAEQLWLTSIYFRDPDGIQLEFGAWWRSFKDDDVSHTPASREDAPPAFDQHSNSRPAAA
jgi:catechol 2,3-dioxygenase-like lactoylglutathione lyase family enzyme